MEAIYFILYLYEVLLIGPTQNSHISPYVNISYRAKSIQYKLTNFNSLISNICLHWSNFKALDFDYISDKTHKTKPKH